MRDLTADEKAWIVQAAEGYNELAMRHKVCFFWCCLFFGVVCFLVLFVFWCCLFFGVVCFGVGCFGVELGRNLICWGGSFLCTFGCFFVSLDIF